jgi:hypothetical protein
MSRVKDRLKLFETGSSKTGSSKETSSGTGAAKKSSIGTFSSRRNKTKGRANKERRVDLSEDEILEKSGSVKDTDESATSKGESRFSAGKFHKSSSPSSSSSTKKSSNKSSKNAAATTTSPLKDLVDLDLVASSSSSSSNMGENENKKSNESLKTKEDKVMNKRQSDISVDVDLSNNNNNNNAASGTARDSATTSGGSSWTTMLTSLWSDPLEEEKKRQDELLMKMMKETDSTFNEESYRLEKQTQNMFVNTKKEELDQKRAGKERKKAERLARLKVPWWESAVQMLMAIFTSSVDSEKRRQEKALLTRLPLLDLRMDEADVRREMETQALLVNMKRKEMDRNRLLHSMNPLQLEKREKSALLAEELADPSVGLDKKMIARGSKIQQNLVRRSMSKSKSIQLAQMEIPLEVQKQMQEEMLLEMADDNPDIGISGHALKRSREVQESLIFYAQKHKQSSWLDSFTKSSSVPQEVIVDNEDEGSSVSSWLGGGWRGSISSERSSEPSTPTPTFTTSTTTSTTAGKKKEEEDGSLSSWLWGTSKQEEVAPKKSPFGGSSSLSPAGFAGGKKKKVNRASWLTLSMMTGDSTKSGAASPPWTQTNLHSLSALGEEGEENDPTII